MPNPPDPAKFVPAFAMPVIAPPPDGGPDAITHYAAVKALCDLVIADVPVSADTNMLAKGLRITIPNPAGMVAGSLAFGTLFALMGGSLRYRRVEADKVTLALASILPAPFDSATPAPSFTAPAGHDASKSWGAFRLTVWGPDFMKLRHLIGEVSACATVYYLGVDEASAALALKPLVECEYPLTAYDKAIAEATKPAFQSVVEKARNQVYVSTPPYATLVADFMTSLMKGDTELMVPGGGALGQAIEAPAPAVATNPPQVGIVELWFLDGGAPPAFIASAEFFRGAPGYDF